MVVLQSAQSAAFTAAYPSVTGRWFGASRRRPLWTIRRTEQQTDLADFNQPHHLPPARAAQGWIQQWTRFDVDSGQAGSERYLLNQAAMRAPDVVPPAKRKEDHRPRSNQLLLRLSAKLDDLLVPPRWSTFGYDRRTAGSREHEASSSSMTTWIARSERQCLEIAWPGAYRLRV